jgi:hypothetical protein
MRQSWLIVGERSERRGDGVGLGLLITVNGFGTRAVVLSGSGDGLGSADRGVALAELRGECSMASLGEADSPRAAPRLGDTASPWAPQNVPCRPEAKQAECSVPGTPELHCSAVLDYGTS